MTLRQPPTFRHGNSKIAPPGEDPLTSLMLGHVKPPDGYYQVADASGATPVAFDELARQAAAQQPQQQSMPSGAQAGRTWEVELPGGRQYEVQASSAEQAAQAAQDFAMQFIPSEPQQSYDQLMSHARRLKAEGRTEDAKRVALIAVKRRQNTSEPSQTFANGLERLSEMSSNPTVQLPQQNSLLGGVVPSPKQAIRNMLDNVMGDDDPTTLNRGEAFGAALNKAGEAMTLGLFGDEAAGQFDEFIGRGNAEDRTEFYRDQEEQLWEQHPGKAMAAEIGGALLGPGKGAGQLVNSARGLGNRALRGGLAGGGAGAVYGAMEGEDADSRASGAAMGGLIGFGGGAAITGVGEGFTRAAQRLKGTPAGQGVVHTLDSLKQAAGELYRGVDQLGVSLPQGTMSRLSETARSKLLTEGFHPRLHPKVAVVLDELENARTGPQSLQSLSQLRRIAGSAASSLELDERRLASVAMDQIDEAIDGLSAVPKEARQLWGQMKRLEKVETMIEDASNSANFEQALQSKFRTFLRNPKNTRGFGDEELAAFKAIAKGGALQRMLAALGKSLSPNSLTGLAAAGGTAYSFDPTLGVALAASGLGSKAAANAMTRRSVGKARDLVGSDATRKKIMDMLRGAPNPLAGAAVLPGGLAQ